MPAATTYKCPNCDGELLFDPGTQKFVCEYCDSSFSEQQVKPQSEEEQEAQPSASPKESVPEADEFGAHAVEYECPSCGAHVMTDDTTAATFCFYCHNPVVLAGRLSGEFKPDKVIPFALERKVVEQEFLSWCKKKKFMKRDFFAGAQQEKLTGVYLPFWIVDSSVDGNLRATGRKIRTWRSGDMEYTETQTYDLFRAAEIDFREMPFAGLDSPEMELSNGIYPYNFHKAVDFSMPYLSGFQAEKRKLDKKDLQSAEVQQIKGYTETLLRETIHGYSGISVSQTNASVLNEQWNYMLLPVWTLTYRYKEKDFYYAMNGQTGKVCGKVPLSFGRLAILFGVVTAAVFLILLLVGGLFL